MTTTTDPLARLLTIMAALRDPDHGCEWDLAQNFATIAPYTIEEAYEVADAIARDDMDALREELGDLLMQVVFHSRMAQEAGHFAFADVADAISDKMEARHPHIFGGADNVGQSREERWENAKAAERAAKGAQSAMDGVALALPALMRAEKLQKRAARVGFDWPDPAGPAAKLVEETAGWKRRATCCSLRSISCVRTASPPKRRWPVPMPNSNGGSARWRHWQAAHWPDTTSMHKKHCGRRSSAANKLQAVKAAQFARGQTHAQARCGQSRGIF